MPKNKPWAFLESFWRKRRRSWRRSNSSNAQRRVCIIHYHHRHNINDRILAMIGIEERRRTLPWLDQSVPLGTIGTKTGDTMTNEIPLAIVNLHDRMNLADNYRRRDMETVNATLLGIGMRT